MYSKNNALSNVLTISFAMIITTIFCFSTFSGDFLYSISPLQALFQISGTDLIKNFDALFSFMVIFMYFGALSILLLAYKILIGINNSIKYGFLFLIIPFLLLAEYTADHFIFIEMSVIAIMFFGREKYGKA